MVQISLQKKFPFVTIKSGEPSSFGYGGFGSGYGRRQVFTGENALGEMGPVVAYETDHASLAMRSWQLRLESDSYNTIHKRLRDTVIGSGLKLQMSPIMGYLKNKGITLDVEKFNAQVESLWSIYANSKMADYGNNLTLGELHALAYAHAITAGDVLVILYVVNKVVKVRLIDSINVMTPPFMGIAMDDKIGYDPIERVNPDTNNRVRWGVEIDGSGQHVAYWVRVGLGLSFERVEARGKNTGNIRAYMLTDEAFRVEMTRGVPRMTSGMETASQLGRYKSAMVSAAEEVAKAPYSIEHAVSASGEDPRAANNLMKARNIDAPAINNKLDYSAEGTAIANTVSASTNRMVTNLPPGAKLAALESKNGLYFETFHAAVNDGQAALAGVAPEIVASKFDSNFSASRAAFLAEGMRLNREWTYQGNHFLNPIFSLMLDIWVQTFEVAAPGYIEALRSRNEYLLNAYRHCTWSGDKMGHIDPMKEVNYWREVLGEGSRHIPLGTVEQATAALSNGDSAGNMIQYARELEDADKLGIQQEDAMTEDETKDGVDTVDNKPKTNTKKK